MTTNRRAFLQAAGLAPAAAFTGAAAAAAPAAVTGELKRSHFAPLTGQRFEFEREVMSAIAATLTEASPLAGAADGERSFRLLFEAQAGQRLEEGSWRVTHPALGSVVVFVSPNDAQGRIAEAIFNRTQAASTAA